MREYRVVTLATQNIIASGAREDRVGPLSGIDYVVIEAGYDRVTVIRARISNIADRGIGYKKFEARCRGCARQVSGDNPKFKVADICRGWRAAECAAGGIEREPSRK